MFNVGDFVRIRPTEIGEYKSHYVFTKQMAAGIGHTGMITMRESVSAVIVKLLEVCDGISFGYDCTWLEASSMCEFTNAQRVATLLRVQLRLPRELCTAIIRRWCHECLIASPWQSCYLTFNYCAQWQ